MPLYTEIANEERDRALRLGRPPDVAEAMGEAAAAAACAEDARGNAALAFRRWERAVELHAIGLLTDEEAGVRPGLPVYPRAPLMFDEDITW